MNDGVDGVEIRRAAVNIVKFPVVKQKLAAEVHVLCVNNKPAKAGFYFQMPASNNLEEGTVLGWVDLGRWGDYVIFVDCEGRLRKYLLTRDLRAWITLEHHNRMRETLTQLFV